VSKLPTESELASIYAKYGYDAIDEQPLPTFLEQIVNELLSSFEPFRRTGRLLDVGFGAGGLLRIAKGRGWTTHGVETSISAIEVGRKNGIGELQHGDFLTVPLEEAAFDVIVMTELIEHLVDPMAFLERAAALLRDGGLLYMTTPHGRGLSGRVLGTSWSVLRPPEHLQLFSTESIKRCVERAGFAHGRVYTQGLLPHELVAAVRRRLPRRKHASPPAMRDRVGKSQRLNETLSRGRGGRLLKKTANLILGATVLGDNLRIEAIR
jgi:SAM-dependent methyltransferase